MRIETSVAVLVLTFLLLVGAAHAASQLDNALSLINVSVSPNPVIAGENATVSFQLYNSYGFWVNNVNLETSGSYPIANVSPQSGLDIAQVNPGTNPFRYVYTFAIPAFTPSGTYKLYFNASYYGLGATQVIATSSMPLSFYVQNKPIIKVVTSSPQPAALYSGYNQTVKLEIENVGFGTARNVSVGVAGEPGVNLLGSVTSFFISNLTRGSTANVSILVSAKNVGQAGILANVAYYSSNFNQRFDNVQKLNLSVAPAAQFAITTQGTGVGVGSTDVPVYLSITNTGTSDASQVQLSLQSSYPITPVASTAYINDLKPGQTANFTFLVNVDTSGVAGSYPVTVYEQWKQPNGAVNQQFSGSNNYFVAVVNSTSSSTLVEAIVIIAIIAIVIMFYKKRTAKKGKK